MHKNPMDKCQYHT
ncbi:hypothetical protein GFU89_15675 [Chryseobacterium sp. JV558]|nr:hypothetical protein [Chryseobacterium sp. JV558]